MAQGISGGIMTDRWDMVRENNLMLDNKTVSEHYERLLGSYRFPLTIAESTRAENGGQRTKFSSFEYIWGNPKWH